MPEQRLHIAVGVIPDAERRRVLIARRPPDTHQGGLWEFPGGKRQAGESRLQTLQRELAEEIDIRIQAAHPLLCFDYDYPSVAVTLDVWVVDRWSGRPRGREGQAIRWAAVGELDAAEFPAANRRIIQMLHLPEVYFITPDAGRYDETFFRRLEELLRGGVRLLRFRSHDLTGAARAQALQRLAGLCRRYDAMLLGDNAAAAAGAGLHLSAQELMRLETRPAAPGWVAASCHNAAELRQARRLGLDFCVLSPVQPTASHPGAAPLGWNAFARLAVDAGLPVYALGGMCLHDLEQAHRHHAHGIALISSLWEGS